MSSATPEKETPQHAPGSDLRLAREAAGISLTDLADRTLISPHRLEALERDDYDAVGGAAYVKGYARACARQLHLDPNHVVQAFEDNLALSHPQVPSPEYPSGKRQSLPAGFGEDGGGSPLRTLVGGLLALIILGLFLVVLFGDPSRSNGGFDSGQVPIDVPESAVDSRSLAVPPPDLAREGSGSGVTSTEPATPDGDGGGKEIDPGAVPAIPLSPVESPPVDQVTPGETGSPRQLDPAPDAFEDGRTPAGESEASTGAPATAPAAGEAATIQVLEISFTDRCWVEVTDANGERIIAREAQSGDNLRLSGPAPFDVVLGNAAAATVTLDGEPVAIKPRSWTNVVRLSLGGS